METNKLSVLDVRLKAFFFLVMIALVFFFNHPLYNLCLLLIMIGIMRWGRLSIRGFFNMTIPMLPVFLIILLFTLFTQPYGLPQVYSEKELFHLLPGGGLAATLGGLVLGLNFLFRILMMIAATYLFISTTSVDDILLLMNQLKASYSMSILLTTAITFIPTMNHKKDLILQAQRARGATIRQGGVFGQLRSFVPIMVPLITNSILMANNLAIAMTNRGYGASRQLTMMRDLSFTRQDWLFTGLTALLLIVAVILRFALGMGIL